MIPHATPQKVLGHVVRIAMIKSLNSQRTFSNPGTQAWATFHSPLEEIAGYIGPIVMREFSVLESSIEFTGNLGHKGLEPSCLMVFDSLRFVFHLSLSISVCLWAFRPFKVYIRLSSNQVIVIRYCKG